MDLKRRAPLLVIGLLAAVVLAGGATTVLAGGPVAKTPRQPASARAALAKVLWVHRGLHVVGGPVSGDGRVLALVTGADKSVWLDSIDPATGAVEWRLPEGFSEITAGVAATPVVVGHYVLAVIPVGGAKTGLVRLEGVDVTTGKVAWHSGGTFFLTDAPDNCPKPVGNTGFCVVAQDLTGAEVLVALAPKTGKVLAIVPNVEREMSTTPGVYETPSKAPVLVGVRVPGGVRWTEAVPKLFGPKGNPDYGWDFDQYGAVEVGTVGTPDAGKTENLAGTTVGFSVATGKKLWSDSGTFQCGGTVGLPGHYLCLMTGTAKEGSSPDKVVLSKDATAKLEGFNPATGKITWQQPVSNVSDLVLANVAIAGSNGLLITTLQGQKRLLNLSTGALTAPGVVWCTKLNLFDVQAAKGISSERVGSSLYTPCDLNGRAVTSAAQPPTVAGATVGHTFVWATKDALEAVTPAG